ncbi:MAG TPA: hypothetical protein VFU21_22670, partial [Kofleriaceae bacterium]|nr:hypothetical protein [Kofleriaceae bacterium]
GRRSLAVAEAGCAALREHVALVVAMLVDSSVVERAAPARAGAPPPVRPEPRWGAYAAAAIAAEAGRLPGWAPGLVLAGGVTTAGGWRAEIGLAGFAGARAADGTGATDLRWLAVSLVGCAPGLGPPGWWAGACAGLEAGAVLAEGSGFARNQSERELLVDALVRVRIERRLAGPAFLALGVTGRLGARRPRFGYEDEAGAFRPLYEPAVAAASAELGVGAHFR